MSEPSPFKGRHYQAEIILLCVRWYLRYALSCRDLAEMMQERGLSMDQSTIWRWVQAYAPELEKRLKPHLKPTTDSWRVDETYIKGRGQWVYWYRALDSAGQTLDFMISETRNQEAARAFFEKILGNAHVATPRVINVDKNAAYPPALEALKAQQIVPESTQLRQVKYLNNLIEQDHRFIKRLARATLGFTTSCTAARTLAGFEIMHCLHKKQIVRLENTNAQAEAQFIARLFGVAA